jgi:large conductance mechanosensitive channel
MWNEFRKFIMRGNVIDLAVGLIIGAAFGAIVSSLVDDIIMPPIGLLLGNVNFNDLLIVLKPGDPPPPYLTLEAAQAAGAVTINYGRFLNQVITFLVVGVAVFFLVRAVNRMYDLVRARPEKVDPTTKECPYCAQVIPVKASRCPFCTSQLETMK